MTTKKDFRPWADVGVPLILSIIAGVLIIWALCLVLSLKTGEREIEAPILEQGLQEYLDEKKERESGAAITEEDEEVPEVVVGDGEQEPTYTTPRSSGWTSFRNAWVQKNPYCVMCGTTGNPHVHHVKSFHEHPELELSLDNLVTLCGPKEKNCHLYWGHDRDGKYGPESANWKTNNPNLRKHIQEYGYRP